MIATDINIVLTKCVINQNQNHVLFLSCYVTKCGVGIVTVDFIPEILDKEAVVRKVDLMLGNNPKNRIHNEGLQEEASAASLSSQAELKQKIHVTSCYNRKEIVKAITTNHNSS